MATADVYQAITDRIVAALESGQAPVWRQPWRNIHGRPMSKSTGKPYTGINPWLLVLTTFDRGYSSQWWGTFKQVHELGGQVRRGENKAAGRGSTTVYFYRTFEKERPDAETGELKAEEFRVARAFSLFNFEQCEGLPEKYAAKPVGELERLPEPDKVSGAYCSNGGPKLKYGGNSAHYQPLIDRIMLPHPGQFRSPGHFAATAFHELGHSTGHESRLNRPGITEFDHFGSQKYSREELVAELTSAMLRAETGVEGDDLFQNDVAYLAHWAEQLKGDPQLFPKAAAEAQKAADVVMEPTRETQMLAEVEQHDFELEVA